MSRGGRTLRLGGEPLGTHRSLVPVGSLPQPAQRLDNDFTGLFDGELLLAVDTLNIDAASFRQMEEVSGGTDEGLRASVLKTVSDRGKQHNPVTGSGGMLLGRVVAWENRSDDLRVGDRVASLVSLSLTPLAIRSIGASRRASAQLDVEGEAVLFRSSAYATLPADIPERLALAVLDVAGAAPQVARLSKPGARVAILGAGGKRGVLCAVEARRSGGSSAKVIGVESHEAYANDLRALGVCDEVVVCDARDPIRVRDAVMKATGGELVDVSFSCVNVPDTEMGAILCTRDRGTAYFFAMSTSFTKAALGAEGVGKDVDLMIGNGFAHGHAEHSLQMMRDFPKVRALFEERYG